MEVNTKILIAAVAIFFVVGVNGAAVKTNVPCSEGEFKGTCDLFTYPCDGNRIPEGESGCAQHKDCCGYTMKVFKPAGETVYFNETYPRCINGVCSTALGRANAPKDIFGELKPFLVSEAKSYGFISRDVDSGNTIDKLDEVIDTIMKIFQ